MGLFEGLFAIFRAASRPSRAAAPPRRGRLRLASGTKSKLGLMISVRSTTRYAHSRELVRFFRIFSLKNVSLKGVLNIQPNCGTYRIIFLTLTKPERKSVIVIMTKHFIGLYIYHVAKSTPTQNIIIYIICIYQAYLCVHILRRFMSYYIYLVPWNSTYQKYILRATLPYLYGKRLRSGIPCLKAYS